MFESAEMGRSVSAEEFGKRVRLLRERLLGAQSRLADADFGPESAEALALGEEAVSIDVGQDDVSE